MFRIHRLLRHSGCGGRGRFQPLRFLLRPVGQLLPLLVGEARGPVDSRIARQRHVAITDAFGDVIPFPRGTFGIVMGPLRKIEPFARIADVAIQPPRNWRNVSIPGPVGFVGVAIVASGAQQRGYLRRRRVGAEQIMAGHERGMSPRRVGELHQREHGNHSRDNPFQTSLHNN